jgi:lathosterol oxidase
MVGEGEISGRLSVFLSMIALGAAACFHFPEYFTTAEFRTHYPIAALRWVLFGCLVLSFGFALTSFLLSRKPRLCFIGVMISALAIVLGGSSVEVGNVDQGLFSISLDWLLLDILVLSAIFIPIELFLPKRANQTKFHPEWKADLVYFAVGHLLVQVTAISVRFPAEGLFGDMGLEPLQAAVSGLPFAVQLLLVLLLADLFQYAAHRSFHASGLLWRFHAVHHSIRSIDWLAGSRLHLVDILVTRAFSYIPLYVCGFSAPVFYTYVIIVSLQAVAAHANTRIPFGWLKYVVVTPQYHHWHHSDDPAIYNKNFAIHCPLIDRLFGTYHQPGDEWPVSMGLGDERFPKGYVRQLLHPFLRDPRLSDDLVDPSVR